MEKEEEVRDEAGWKSGREEEEEEDEGQSLSPLHP